MTSKIVVNNIEADVGVNTVTISGDITATSFNGSGANLTGISQVGGSTGVDFNDNVKARFGTGNDLSLFHDSNRSAINNATGELRILSGSDVTIGKRSGDDSSYSEQLATFKVDGAIELYNNNVKVIETNTTGIQVGFDGGVSNPTIKLPDNGYLTWGTSDAAFIQGADAGSGGYLKFNANNGQRATIDGHGLKFGTDTAQANALDDYEEGSWTPTFVNLDDSSKATLNYASYTKIGRLVHIDVKFFISSSVSDTSGLGITMPFTKASVSGGSETVFPAMTSKGNISVFFRMFDSQSNAYGREVINDSYVTYNEVAGDEVFITGTYEAT